MIHRSALMMIVILVGLAQPCIASQPPPEVLNPRVYSSPSGRYRLEVDPSQMHGEGLATYRMTRDGVEVWAGTRPVTFWQAAVSDGGVAAGYGYTTGVEGFRDPGEFHVVIFGPDGQYRLNHRVKRVASSFLHASPDPEAVGLMIDPVTDRMIVRVPDADLNRGHEAWWTYRFSDGSSTGIVVPLRKVPNFAESRRIIEARVIVGTPLILVQFWHYPDGRNVTPGSRFVLFDQQYRPAWVLTRAGDYPNEELMLAVQRNGAILRPDVPGQFDLRFGKENSRVTFEASPDPARADRWNVREIARTQYVEPALATRPSEQIDPIDLKHLGTITLRAAEEVNQPIRNIFRQAVDGNGRIGFLRREQGEGMSFVLVDIDGKVLCEVRPEGFGRADRTGQTIGWIGGQRWLIADAPFGVGAKLRAWWIDAEDGKIEPITGLDCPAISSAAGTGDGGFVVLTDQHERATIVKEMIAFDSTGKRRWNVNSDSGDARKLFSPDDLTLTSDRKIAVLENPGDCVKFFSIEGRYLSTTDLKRALGAGPNYPTGLAADRNGGIVVHNFNGTPPLWRLTADGKVGAKLDPAYSDRRKFALYGFAVAPSGHVWVSDGQALLRLDPQGVVDRVLGTPPNPDSLGKISGLTVDGAGRIYAVDSRSASVHVFDDQGRLLKVLKPRPEDFPANAGVSEIDVSSDGHVYIGDRHSRLHFLPGGGRAGMERLGIDPIAERRYFGSIVDQSWALGYEAAFLFNAEGKIVRRIDRKPNREWLAHPQQLAFGPDGSAVIFTGDMLRGSDAPAINLYNEKGDPIRTLPSPIGRYVFSMAHTGRWIILSGESEVYFASTDGSRVRRFTLRLSRPMSYWTVFARPHTAEVWMWQAGEQNIERFAVPE